MNTIFDKKFIKVKECKNEPYFYSERLGIDSVAFILKNKDKYGLIVERKPPLDERKSEIAVKNMTEFQGDLAFLATAFGGSNDSIEIEEYKNLGEIERIYKFKDTVLKEVREEAGYEVERTDIEYIDKIFVSTQSNQFCYLFIVNIEGKQSFEPEFENETEAMSRIEWFNKKDILTKTYDWKAKTIIAVEEAI